MPHRETKLALHCRPDLSASETQKNLLPAVRSMNATISIVVISRQGRQSSLDRLCCMIYCETDQFLTIAM